MSVFGPAFRSGPTFFGLSAWFFLGFLGATSLAASSAIHPHPLAFVRDLWKRIDRPSRPQRDGV